MMVGFSSNDKNYFLKYDERLRSISFFARAPDCRPSDASARAARKIQTKKVKNDEIQDSKLSQCNTAEYNIPSSKTSPRDPVKTPIPASRTTAKIAGT